MDNDTLKEAKEAFKLSSDAESEQRIRSLEDLRFARLGEQWPAEIKKQRELEGRPCLTHNRMPAFARQVVNDARQNRPAIKCHPVGNGSDREVADIYSGLIRNIEYSSNADVAYDTGLEFAVYGGIGYMVVRTDYTADDSFDLDLQIDPVYNPFSVYGDPHSTGADSADWNTAFITDVMSEEDFERRWPGADLSDFRFDGGRDALWFPESKIQVAEWWKRDEVLAKLLKLSDGTVLKEEDFVRRGTEGGPSLQEICAVQGITVVGDRVTRSQRVTQRIMTGCEVLETKAWKGKYIPIVPVYGEQVNIEGKRHFLSLIHFAKDAQKQYNFWRTATTEMIALAPKAPFIGAKGQFDSDAAKWSQINSSSLSHVEYDPVDGAPPPMRQPFAGPPTGALQEALNASDDMKNIMGIHDASLGARSNETSGRAIMARQREGDVSTFNYIDNLARAIKHVGRILVDLIPHHYDTARIIRVIKEDGSNFSMPINQPVVPQRPNPPPGMAGAMAMPPQVPQMGGGGAQMPLPTPAQEANQPQGQPQYRPVQPHEQNDPTIASIVKSFDLTAGKYDVTVETGPSYTTRREESAAQMLEFMRLMPQAAPLIGDLLAKNLDWPGADEIGKRLQAMLPPQIQGQNPQVAALQNQMKQMDGHAREAVGKLGQELQKMQQQLGDKSKEESIKEYEAETKRIAALADAVKNGVQLTQTAEGGVQATPLMRDTVSPDMAVDANLRTREMDIRERELAMKERESAAKVLADTTAANAQKFAQIDVPTHQLQQHQAHHEAMVGALATVANAVQQKPTIKRAKAIKQGDGSFVLESIETPVDQPQAPPEGTA